MIVLVLVRQWGPAWGIVAYVLWWVNTTLAVIAVMGIPYVFVKVQPPGVKAVTPVVLLPLISTLTSAAGGGVICRYGALSDRLQVPVIIVSYLEVGLGIALAMAFNNVFVTRLFDRSFPPPGADTSGYDSVWPVWTRKLRFTNPRSGGRAR